jgi:hypothetical protein
MEEEKCGTLTPLTMLRLISHLILIFKGDIAAMFVRGKPINT